MPELETYSQLQTELQAKLEAFAPGQQRIAKVLLSDPEGTAFRSIAETAKIAEVNQSSLVRFATMMGFKGYPALVRLCREHLSDQANIVRRFDRAQQLPGSDSLFAAVLDHEKDNLTRTYARIDQKKWDEVVKALAEAPHVYTMGLRKCAPVAQLLAYLLRLVRPGVEQIAPAAGVFVDQLRDLDPEGVFVAISIRRYTADTIRALNHAKNRGLRTVALTDDSASPLARLADTTFYIETEGVTILRSMTVFTSIAQTLATAVTIHNGARSRKELLIDEQLLQDFNVYAEA
ncbi:DNA-binding MurR/RpiR family transcriptional regulator [Paenarthrobacter nicotinovorans]|uniref:DNA-binding MurR/RpiR family transcriptional regulator n=1 Tax=Paenarthrobacter nicotinovorans TaxID=29320 RepID=A0ABT9TQ72_PAENI|nr:MurR/RpiR family transcriptional regulator [Paenarthrobacter nicotinovorans]MDQ0103033.1 DNA-binding MurR/RpiR family transcriptional regulator [Paenarthrobacter nicotinovorans]